MKVYLVGGAVRDQLLHFPFHEKDWVVVGSTPQEMVTLGYTPIGKDFPVFLHPQTHEEYALARTERKTSPGYKGFTFHTHKDVTLEGDLQRRDLTINAIAQDDNGTLIDPYNGQKDISNKCLRHVSTAFSEDPVRVLRVARFAARYHHLGFTIADETIHLIKSMVTQGETQHLVPERVWQECQKALSELHPNIFFNVLRQCNALGHILPTLPEASFDTCLDTLIAASKLSDIPLIRFSAFCSCLDTPTVESLCKHLNTPTEYRDLALLTSKHHEKCIDVNQWNEQLLTNLFQQTDALRKPERFQQLLITCHSIVNTQNPQSKFKQQLLLCEALEIYKDIDPQVLIQQGYQKAALGKAIIEERLKALQGWLQTQKFKSEI